MDVHGRSAPVAASPGRLFVLAAGAVGCLVAYRVGMLPGGLVGVDVVAALVGWWFASTVVRGAAFGELVGLVWRRTWPALVLAVAMTLVWVLITPSTRLDVVVRGEVVAAFGGYGNWHQLTVGPLEVPARPLASPLQHLWAMAVLVQGVALLALGSWATRPRARRRPASRDPLVLLGVVVAALCVAYTVVLVVSGATGQTLLLATTVHGSALFLGVAFGALAAGDQADDVRAVAVGIRWIALGLLAAAALVASPTSAWWRAGGAVAVPIAAALVVAGWVPWPPGRQARSKPPPVDPWMALISLWILHVPALALAAPARTGLPDVVASVAGLGLAALLSFLVTVGASQLPLRTEALELRRVVVPPLVVALVVLVFAATGAFHWTSPHPRSAPVPAAHL